jgi:hypothetical protein
VKIPIPGSHPTNPPKSYGKALPSKATMSDVKTPPDPVLVAAEEGEESSDNDDEKLDEENMPTPWTGALFLAGQYFPPPTVEEAAAALKDLSGECKEPKAKLISNCRT